MRFRAVIFDLGGVVLGSPMSGIAGYERERGLPQGLINRLVVAGGPSGAWSRLERGELGLEDFYTAFDAECAAEGARISAEELMRRIGEAAVPRASMLEAIRRVRARGLAAAALTNNWEGERDGTRALREHFDAFFESSVLGMRKPDPRIYRTACSGLGIEPGEAVFLDDIGRNLKAARVLGMTTLKVVDPDSALDALAALLGFPLRDTHGADS